MPWWIIFCKERAGRLMITGDKDWEELYLRSEVYTEFFSNRK